MDEKKILEEQLREAACNGDVDVVQELIEYGVDVNARHSINGWTPLHWACKRNYVNVTALLLKYGADKTIKSDKGETPAEVTRDPFIVQMLNGPCDFSTDESGVPAIYVPNICQEEVVLKIRVANASDPDFIEVDLPRNALTYQNLVKLCCDELGINATQLVKLRKLPNTKIRRDKDVQRLENFQEIEVVIHSSVHNDGVNKSMQYANGSTVPITPTNNYQSISKKDQTILY